MRHSGINWHEYNFCMGIPPDKCARCNLQFECELRAERILLERLNPESTIPVYNNEYQNNCKVGSSLVAVPCGAQYVADGIGDDFKIMTDQYSQIVTGIGKWEPERPVVISAQTGRGKNHFVERTLLPYLRKLNITQKTNNKVLIISNRLALKLQMGKRIHNILRDESESLDYSIYSQGLFADIVTYQGLLNQVEHLKRRQRQRGGIDSYIYIVCDEAHFFTSDAMFNPNTAEILSTLVQTFQNAVRIYMTATPYDCLGNILDYERKFGVDGYGKRGIFYHFQRDYSYLDIKCFSFHNELVDIIAKSVTDGEKWLIFIDNIEKGRDFKNKLESDPCLEGKIMAVDANSKYDERYQKMVLNERFDTETSVLISTSVLDNGVNFRSVDNVVVSDIDKVKCLQMVGRARVERDQRVTLYLKRNDSKLIEKRLANLEKQQDAYHVWDIGFDPPQYAYNRAGINAFENKYVYGNPEDQRNFKHWFWRSRERNNLLLPGCSIKPNSVARSMVEKLVPRYEAILDEMLITDVEPDVTGQKYLEYQLAWFGKEYDKRNDITLADKDEVQKELINFLESYAVSDVQLACDEQSEFSKKFTEFHDRAFARQDPNLNRNYGINKMNGILESRGICYKIESKRKTIKKGKKETFWKIARLSEEADGLKPE